MRTTIALDSAHRDRLLRLKDQWGLRSVDEVVQRLLDGPTPTAEALYRGRKTTVDAVLTRYKVKRLIAFGSRARGDARPGSDLDLAVQLPPEADLFDLVHLGDELAQAFETPVDVVDWDGLKPPVQRRAEREGVVLYG